MLSKLFLEEIEIWEMLHADGSSVLEATPCAFTGAEVDTGALVRKSCSSHATRAYVRTWVFNVECVLRGAWSC